MRPENGPRLATALAQSVSGCPLGRGNHVLAVATGTGVATEVAVELDCNALIDQCCDAWNRLVE